MVVIGALALALCLAVARIATLADPSRHIGELLAAYVVCATAGIAGAALLWHRSDRRSIAVLVVAALVARAILLPSAPFLSHDAYRYLWDGTLLAHGYNPLAVAPDSNALATLHHSPLYAFIDWRTIPSLYPPAAYALFFIGALFSPASVIGEKLVMSLGDVLALGALVATLRLRKLPLGRAAIYAWNPLVLLEFSQSGHVEAWTIAAIVASAYFLDSGRTFASGAAMSLAVLTKLYPAVLAPVAFARNRIALVTAGTIVVAVYAVSFAINPHTFGSLDAYVNEQRFNATLFALLGSKGAAAALLAGTAYAVVLRRRGVSLAAALFGIELVYLLVLPSVLPWYVAVIAAIIPLMACPFDRTWRPVALGAIGWTVTAPLAYAAPLVVAGGSPGDLLVRAVEYAPIAVGVALVAKRSAETRLRALRPYGARA